MCECECESVCVYESVFFLFVLCLDVETSVHLIRSFVSYRTHNTHTCDCVCVCVCVQVYLYKLPPVAAPNTPPVAPVGMPRACSVTMGWG